MAIQGNSPGAHPFWNDRSVIHHNTLPPRASFLPYPTEADALTYDASKAKAQSLSGTWKFNCANSPFEAPAGFQLLTYNASTWGTIEVPGMWQLQDYGNGSRYKNIVYSFPVDPPNVPSDGNETGSYVRTFTVPSSFRGHQLRLRFEGVSSAFNVWINGKHAGYSQGSWIPSEFDITELVDVRAENKLAVQVYQFCDGSYIEDQVGYLVLCQNYGLHPQVFPHMRYLHNFTGSMVAERNFSRSGLTCISKSPYWRLLCSDATRW